MLLKNVSGQGVFLYAWDSTNAVAKTGDAANITGAYSLDGAAETSGFSTAHPTEIGGGVYWQPLAQGETNANLASYRWSSTTSGILIDPLFVHTTGVGLPAVAYAGSGGLPTVGTGTGQLNVSGGRADANVLRWNGTAVPAENTAGYPLVDAAKWVGGTIPAAAVAGVPKVDVVDWLGTAVTAATTAGKPDVVVVTNNDKTGYTASTVSDKTGYSLSQAFPANFASLAVDTSGNVTAKGLRIEKNTALSAFPIVMKQSGDHYTPLTGATVAVQRSLDGAAFADCTNTPATEVGGGLYKIDLTAADTNANVVVLKATAGSGDTRFYEIITQTP